MKRAAGFKYYRRFVNNREKLFNELFNDSMRHISSTSCSHLIYDSPVLTTPFLLRLMSYRRFSRMYNTRVRFACPIYFSRDQSSSKLIIFLDSKLERSNSRVAKIDSRLDSRNFRGSRIESRVEFRNSRVTVNLPLSGTVCYGYWQGPIIAKG